MVFNAPILADAITKIEVYYDASGPLYRVTDFGGVVTETRDLKTLIEWIGNNHVVEGGQ